MSSNIGNDGPKEDMIEDCSGTTFHSCLNNIYHQLFETIQTSLTDQKYQYLIIQLKTYRLNDIKWTEFESILNAHNFFFTDDQWSQVQYLLSHDRLKNSQFSIFTDMIDTSQQKLVLLHAGGGTGNSFVTVKSLKNYSCVVKFVVALVQQELVHLIYHKDVHFTVCSKCGHQI